MNRELVGRALSIISHPDNDGLGGADLYNAIKAKFTEAEQSELLAMSLGDVLNSLTIGDIFNAIQVRDIIKTRQEQ